MTMKRTLLCLFAFILLGSATGVCAAERNLRQGEYKLFAFSLQNGSTEPYPANTGPKIKHFGSLYISPEAINNALNTEQGLPGSPQANLLPDPYQGFAIKAAYAPTSNIILHSSLGLTDTTTDKTIAYKDRVGWELDLGVAYKFLNKFAYEVHFGYMDTGQLFSESYNSPDITDITIVVNKLTMSF